MFSEVIEEAKKYTRPVVTIFKLADGKVFSSVATYIHIDDIGHILSAKHIFTMGSDSQVDASAVIFDLQYSQAEYIAEDSKNDLVLLKIKDYKPGSIKIFPKFLRSLDSNLPRFTPLVRLGFPNSSVDATWDERKKCFNWIHGNFVFFDNNGVSIGYEIDRENNTHLLETNFPARMGQSGGPVITTQGVVVGIQSKNSIFENLDCQDLEIGVAASHVAIASLLEKYPATKPSWI